jgi:hypothetical protein
LQILQFLEVARRNFVVREVKDLQLRKHSWLQFEVIEIIVLHIQLLQVLQVSQLFQVDAIV